MNVSGAEHVEMKPSIPTHPSSPIENGSDRLAIHLTERAAAKVKEIVEGDETLVGQGLRVKVVGGGCAGFSYDLHFEDQITDMDETFESRGIPIYVDPLSFQYLENTEIDYIEDVHASGFKFNNPNAKGSCGCGSSVSF